MLGFLKKTQIAPSPSLSPQSSPSAVKSDKSNKSDTSSKVPRPRDYPNAPKNYVKAMEKHFDHNMDELYNHLKSLSSKEQEGITAIIDGSHEFRRFLGITDPNSLKNKVNRKLHLGSSSRIKDVDAPIALAIFATKSNDPKRVGRSLERLDQSLGNLLRMKRNGQISYAVYQEASNRALTKLAQELGNLPTKEAFEKAVTIFEKSFLMDAQGTVRGRSSLSTGGLEEFVSSIDELKKKGGVMENLGIGDKFKESLNKMTTTAKNAIKLDDSWAKEHEEKIKEKMPQYLKNQKKNLEKDGGMGIVKDESSENESAKGKRVRFSS